MTVFGPIVAPWNIERAVLATLEAWLPAYLFDVETKNGLPKKFLGRPPDPESYKGGLDWESVEQKYLPAVIVNANPLGEPERSQPFYMQNFQVEVGCVVFSEEGTEPEAAARKIAGLFSAATMLLEQQSGLMEVLPGLEEIVLVGAPKVEHFLPERREFAVGVTSWRVYAELFQPNAGAVSLKEIEPEGPYPEYPLAKEHEVKVRGEPLDKPL